MACGARSGLKRFYLRDERLLLGRLNGLWSPFEGRKYSGSRIAGEDVAYVECAVIALIPDGDYPSVGIREDQRRPSERCLSDTKGSRRQVQAALTLGSV